MYTHDDEKENYATRLNKEAMIYVRKGKSRWKKYSITLLMKKKKTPKGHEIL